VFRFKAVLPFGALECFLSKKMLFLKKKHFLSPFLIFGAFFEAL
jgi:hypothetical protein